MGTQVAAPQPLAQIAGQQVLWEFTVLRDGAVLDITGMALAFVIVKQLGRQPVLQAGANGIVASISSGPEGKFRVLIPDDATDNSLAGDYHYQATVTDSDGASVPVAYGPYSVEKHA